MFGWKAPKAPKPPKPTEGPYRTKLSVSSVSGARMVINGVEYNAPSGKNISMRNGIVYVDNEEIANISNEKQPVSIKWEGPLAQLTVVGDATINGSIGGHADIGGDLTVNGDVHGSIDAGGDVSCGNVDGDIDAGGDISCGNIDGNIDAGGDVSCGNVEGNIDAGGDVSMRRGRDEV